MNIVLVLCFVFIVLESDRVVTQENRTFSDEEVKTGTEKKPELIAGEALLNAFAVPQQNNSVQLGPEKGLPTVLDIIKGWTYKDTNAVEEEEGGSLDGTEAKTRTKRHHHRLKLWCNFGLCGGGGGGVGYGGGGGGLTFSIGLPVVSVSTGGGYPTCTNCGYTPQQVAVPVQVPVAVPVQQQSYNPCDGGGCNYQPPQIYNPCSDGSCIQHQTSKPQITYITASKPKPFYNPCLWGGCNYQPQPYNPCEGGGCNIAPKPSYNPCADGRCVHESLPQIKPSYPPHNPCGEGGCVYQPVKEIKPAYNPCAGGECVYEHNPSENHCEDGGCIYQPITQIKPVYNPCEHGGCNPQPSAHKLVSPCPSGGCVTVPVKESCPTCGQGASGGHSLAYSHSQSSSTSYSGTWR